MSKQVTLQKAIIMYPHLYEMHKAAPTADPKYSAEFMVEPNGPDHVALYQAFVAVLQEEGKGDFIQTMKPPYETGEEHNQRRLSKALEARSEVTGKILINAKDGSIRPVVVAQDGQTPITEEQSGNIFSGCIVRAKIDLYWTKGGGQNPGVYAGLRGVQLVNNVDVERLGAVGGPVTFDPVEGHVPVRQAQPQGGPAPTLPQSVEPDWM